METMMYDIVVGCVAQGCWWRHRNGKVLRVRFLYSAMLWFPAYEKTKIYILKKITRLFPLISPWWFV